MPPVVSPDHILANLSFNHSDGIRKDIDVHWDCGIPPKRNSDFAWVQHFIHHLAVQSMAHFFIADPSLSSRQIGNSMILN
jgi:type I restriction enzyme M protein